MESYVIKQKINKAILWKKGQLILRELSIELTERCNNNCLHCYINLPVNDLKAKNKELSTEKIKQILKEAASLGCMFVRFTGGEPLLREDFQELYIFTRRLGVRVFLSTNATLINPRLSELFVRIPPLEKIAVTLYGMKKSSYEAVTRTSGSFEAAWRGINLLLEKKIPFVVKGAILPVNRNEIGEFAKWAKTIPWMDDRPPYYTIFFDLHCRRDGTKNELIKKYRVSAGEGLKILTREKEEYTKGIKSFCSKFMCHFGIKLFSCGAGYGNGCVDAYGIFQPCMMLRHPECVYDLKRGSLRDALTNFFPTLRETKANNPRYLARCARCFLKGFCGQCPAKSWAEHGTLDTPVEYLCEVAHAQAKFLGLVKKNERAWEIDDWQERVRKFIEKVGDSHASKNSS